MPISQILTWTRVRFWEAGVPLSVREGPRGSAVAVSDFGREIAFKDKTAVEYFLAGFKVGRDLEAIPAGGMDITVPPPLGGEPGEEEEEGGGSLLP
jgi:hypothetical protein